MKQESIQCAFPKRQSLVLCMWFFLGRRKVLFLLLLFFKISLKHDEQQVTLSRFQKRSGASIKLRIPRGETMPSGNVCGGQSAVAPHPRCCARSRASLGRLLGAPQGRSKQMAWKSHTANFVVRKSRGYFWNTADRRGLSNRVVLPCSPFLLSRYRGKTYRAVAKIVRTSDQVADFCRRVCAKLECCPNLFSPVLVSENCPENCSIHTKTKYSEY